MKSDGFKLFSPEELLGGLPAKRASTLIFALENRTAKLAAQSQQGMDIFGTENTDEDRESVFLESLAQGREPLFPISIQDLERYASQWAFLIPDNPGVRAAVAYLLEQKYEFNYQAVPNIRAALGLDKEAVQEHYKRDVMIAKETFQNILRLLPILTVDVLPFNQDFSEVLLFKRVNRPAKNEYFSPGGRLLKNEEVLEGARRQCKRELGLEIEKEDLLPGGVIDEIWEESAFEGVNYHSVNIFFGYVLSAAQFSCLTLDEQHEEYKWFSVSDPSIHPWVKYRIETILALLRCPDHPSFRLWDHSPKVPINRGNEL